MLAKKLAAEIKREVKIKDDSFNLNFKIEANDAEKFDRLAKICKKSRTELAKFIILNSLDYLIDELGSLDIEVTTNSEIEDLEEAILKCVLPKIASIDFGKTFELKELVGNDWGKIGDHGHKNRVGKLFKKLVDDGYIKNVKFVETKPNNHALYEKMRV